MSINFWKTSQCNSFSENFCQANWHQSNVFVQLIADARLIVLQKANSIDFNLLQYTRAWQIKRYDKFCERNEFQNQFVDMYFERTTSFFIKTRLSENDINNDFDASLNENENERNDLSEHSNQKLLVKDFDVSNNEIENVAKSKSKRKIKIETKMIVFDERNLIEVSNYQEFEFEFDDNMKYDDTTLST